MATQKCFDAVGHMVPENLREVFTGCRNFADMDALVKQLQTRIDALADLPGGKLLKNHLRPELNPDGSKSYCFGGLEAFKDRLKNDRPHGVCPCCSGNQLASCNACEGKGWLPVNQWKNAKLTQEKQNQGGPQAV